MTFVCGQSAISGLGGHVIAWDNFRRQVIPIARLLRWEYEGSTQWVEWADTGSRNTRWVNKSTTGGQGSFVFAFDAQRPQSPPIGQGGAYSLHLGAFHSVFVPTNESSYFLPNILVTTVSYTVDVREGSVVEGQATFVASGPVLLPDFQPPGKPQLNIIIIIPPPVPIPPPGGKPQPNPPVNVPPALPLPKPVPNPPQDPPGFV